MAVSYEDKPNIVQIDKSGNHIEIAYGGPQGVQGPTGPAGPAGGPTGPTGATGPAGASGAFALTFPTNPYAGQVWYNLETGKMYVYITDGDSNQWVQVATAPQGPTGPSGVVSVVGPVTNTGTATSATLGLNQDGFDHISNLDYAQFDTTNTTAPTTAGRLAWNNTDGTLDLRLKDGSVTLQLGQEIVARALNNTGTAIAEGRVVRISGASGQRLTIALASNDGGDASSATTIGVVTQSGGIGNNQQGYVTLFGLVRELNTSAFEEGDILWLNSNGLFSATKPVAPLHGVQIGYVVVAGNNGTIYVHVQNGYELDELHNVKITNPLDGDVLKYQASTGLWINGPA